jgi:pantoate--beta-alanine ligase
MIAVQDLAALRDVIGKARAESTIALVPTMGALHEGHLSLVRQARREGGFVVVSIFVNPLQFAPHEDFSRYPRRPEEDAAALEAEEVDVLWAPRPETFYPSDFSTAVEVGGVSERGEGAVRPTHFRGVATVVAKLFLQVQPDVAVFGRKDLQQLAVIRRMVRDLDFPVRIAVGETVREADGLALSSRNAYLSPDERRRATALPRALFAARELARGRLPLPPGEGRGEGVLDPAELARRTREELERSGLVVDYVEVVDVETMKPPPSIRSGTALAAAVRVGETRLIDNVLLMPIGETR